MVTQAGSCTGCGTPVSTGASVCRGCAERLMETVAGFWTRFLAWIIDSVILFIPNFLIGAVIAPPASFAIQIVIGFVYFVGFLTAEGATPGKMVMGVIVLKVDGEQVTPGAAVVRYFGYWLSSITLGIGYLMIGIRGDKRGLHDLVAGTIVVKKQELEQYLQSVSEPQSTSSAG